jgi:hypothetical protein
MKGNSGRVGKVVSRSPTSKTKKTAPVARGDEMRSSVGAGSSQVRVGSTVPHGASRFASACALRRERVPEYDGRRGCQRSPKFPPGDHGLGSCFERPDLHDQASSSLRASSAPFTDILRPRGVTFCNIRITSRRTLPRWTFPAAGALEHLGRHGGEFLRQIRARALPPRRSCPLGTSPRAWQCRASQTGCRPSGSIPAGRHGEDVSGLSPVRQCVDGVVDQPMSHPVVRRPAIAAEGCQGVG